MPIIMWLKEYTYIILKFLKKSFAIHRQHYGYELQAASENEKYHHRSCIMVIIKCIAYKVFYTMHIIEYVIVHKKCENYENTAKGHPKRLE